MFIGDNLNWFQSRRNRDDNYLRKNGDPNRILFFFLELVLP